MLQKVETHPIDLEQYHYFIGEKNLKELDRLSSRTQMESVIVQHQFEKAEPEKWPLFAASESFSDDGSQKLLADESESSKEHMR